VEPVLSLQRQVSGSSATFSPRARVSWMMSSSRMPVRMRACTITTLGTWPTGDCPAIRMARNARVNCSSSQNTMAETPSATPGQPNWA